MENPRLGKERGCGRGQAQGASRGQGGRKEGLLGNCLCLVSWKENRARLEGDEERSPGRSTPSRCPPPPHGRREIRHSWGLGPRGPGLSLDTQGMAVTPSLPPNPKQRAPSWNRWAHHPPHTKSSFTEAH